MVSEFQDAIAKLELHEGDIILVDARAVDIAGLAKSCLRPEFKHWILAVFPEKGMTLNEVVRTAKLENLKAVIAAIEKEQ
jgi:hypothetical protein